MGAREWVVQAGGTYRSNGCLDNPLEDPLGRAERKRRVGPIGRGWKCAQYFEQGLPAFLSTFSV